MLFHILMMNQYRISTQEMMLNPRQRPNNPPTLEIKSVVDSLNVVWYSDMARIVSLIFSIYPTIPIAVGFPKNMLTTAMSFSKAL